MIDDLQSDSAHGNFKLTILHKFSCGICIELLHDFLPFTTPGEAFVHATEINKPYYYDIFGAGYEVCYLDRNSWEWKELDRDMENCLPLLNLILQNHTCKHWETFAIPSWFKNFFDSLFPKSSSRLP